MRTDYKKVLAYFDGIVKDEARTEDLKAAYTHIKDRLQSEHGFLFSRPGISHQAVCAGWLQGAAIGIDLYNCDILKLAREWGGLAADATEKQEDKILKNWWLFAAMNLNKAAKKHGVEVY